LASFLRNRRRQKKGPERGTGGDIEPSFERFSPRAQTGDRGWGRRPAGGPPNLSEGASSQKGELGGAQGRGEPPLRKWPRGGKPGRKRQFFGPPIPGGGRGVGPDLFPPNPCFPRRPKFLTFNPARASLFEPFSVWAEHLRFPTRAKKKVFISGLRLIVRLFSGCFPRWAFGGGPRGGDFQKI